MKLKIKTLDPTDNIIEEKNVDLPINIYNGNGEPMCKNYYVIELGNVKLRISKIGKVQLI